MILQLKYSSEFVPTWDFYMMLGAIVFLCLSLGTFLFYESRITQIKEIKEKYDYVILNEIKFFWYSVLLIIAAVAFLSNTVMTDWIMRKGWDWFLGRIFLTVCIAIVLYVMFKSMVRIYYPKYMERRLEKLRNKPRISPAGNTMRKLSEEEEDAHLEADQIAEEGSEVHSVDYDVWLDEKTGFKKIEKYYSYHHVVECPSCGYVTMKIHHEEVTLKPTMTEPGELVKHYRCIFCNHRERQSVHLAKLADNVA
jgi:hypothetical protein